MRLSYAVKEVFLTLQGEGRWAGHRAVFVRFTGCNVWTGQEKDRERDTGKGCCAAWCDTNFKGTDGRNGGVYGRADLVAAVVKEWKLPILEDSPLVRSKGTLLARTERAPGEPLVVFTGGEPGLQLDDALVGAMRAAGLRVHVETNGSVQLPHGVDWVALSPKPPMQVVSQRFDEVKVVYPAVDPAAYENLAPHRYLQPLDVIDPDEAANNLTDAIDYVIANPQWMLGLQTHKVLELP